MAKRLELEGVIAKRRDSRYQPGKSDGWFKLQLKKQQEFVIGGYKPENRNFGSILVGFYEEGKFIFCGKVKAGFNRFNRIKLFTLMKPLETSTCPFSNLPTARTGHWGEGVTADDMKEIKWLKPKLVAQIRFTEWTRGGNLRHAAYLGLRDDKQAIEVMRIVLPKQAQVLSRTHAVPGLLVGLVENIPPLIWLIEGRVGRSEFEIALAECRPDVPLDEHGQN